MKELMQAVLAELDRREMLEVTGGGDSGGNIAHDFGLWLGYIVGSVEKWYEAMPAPSYAYAKVGYSS